MIQERFGSNHGGSVHHQEKGPSWTSTCSSRAAQVKLLVRVFLRSPEMLSQHALGVEVGGGCLFQGGQMSCPEPSTCCCS